MRELRNVINRAFIMARGESLTVDCLPDKLLGNRSRRLKDSVIIPLGQPMEEVERIVIEETLNMTDGDRRKTAEILGISYKTLYNKTKKYKAAGGGATTKRNSALPARVVFSPSDLPIIRGSINRCLATRRARARGIPASARKFGAFRNGQEPRHRRIARESEDDQ